MLLWVAVFLLLQLPLSGCIYSLSSCFDTMESIVYKSGDVVVGGFFPLYTFNDYAYNLTREPRRKSSFYRVNPNKYQYVLSCVYAVEEINKNPQLLPNISLGYEIHNVVPSQPTILESSILLLRGRGKTPNYSCRGESTSVAVLTGTSWATSAQIGAFLELYRFPQLAFGSFHPIVSSNGQFPSLYQMAPRDTSLALGMVSLMVHFSWTWVGLVITDDEKGVQFLSSLRREMDKKRVCAAFVSIISSSYGTYEPKIYKMKSRKLLSAKVCILYLETNSLFNLSLYAQPFQVTCAVWVTNSQWHAVTTGSDFLLNRFHGSLIFSSHREVVSGFENFIQRVSPSKYPEDKYLTRLWFANFDCSPFDSDCTLKNCPPNASLSLLPKNRFDPAMTDESHGVYNAVYAVAHALHEVLLQQAQGNQWQERVMTTSPWQLHAFLKNSQFNNPVGYQVNLDDTRKPDAEYDIINFQDFPKGLRLRAKVGHFSPRLPHGQQLLLSEDMIEWATGSTHIPKSTCSESCNPGFRKSHWEGESACCFYCTPCPENEISNQTDMEQCVKCGDHQYANSEQNLCLQKSVRFLAYEDPLGKALAGTALTFTVLTGVVLGIFVKHRDTPIVKANNRSLSYILLLSLALCFLCSLLFIGRPNLATCILRHTAFGVVFTVAIASVLAKTLTVVLAFKLTAPGRKLRHWLVSWAPKSIIPICSLIQLTLCGLWMGTSPPFIDTDMQSEHSHIIIQCNKGSLTAFYCELAYLLFPALASFSLAFLARNLPDTFNEAKFLTFSMLVFCTVWVSFLPVYHSTRGTVVVAMEVFSIVSSSAGLLGCIFVPKCYIILLRPHWNSLRRIRDKTHAGREMSSSV